MAGPAPQAPSAETSFNGEMRPLLQKYCLVCHSAEKHTGDVNLERYASYKDVLEDPRVWQKLVEQVSLGEMPPKGMPQPDLDQRGRLVAWANGALKIAARAHAGDPGPVVLRRLNNAEYTFTIRDLTGVASLEPAKEFPVDGAAGEGFTNTGNALAMSPSLVTKYLDAGKVIASHAVLLPDGIRFSPGVSRRDWTDAILAEIRALYRKYTEEGGSETVMQQGMALDKNRGGVLPLRKYLAASLALRASGTATVESVARQNGLSPKYLAILVNLMKSTHPSPLLDGLRAQWRTATPDDIDGMVNEIARWQSTLWKFSSVGHIGKVDGPKAWMEPVDPVVDQQQFRVKLAAPQSGNDVTVYLVARDAGDGQSRRLRRVARTEDCNSRPAAGAAARPAHVYRRACRAARANFGSDCASADGGCRRRDGSRGARQPVRRRSRGTGCVVRFPGRQFIHRFQARSADEENQEDRDFRFCAGMGLPSDADADRQCLGPASARAGKHEAA